MKLFAAGAVVFNEEYALGKMACFDEGFTR